MTRQVDYEQLARIFIKALRGSQTQEALSLDLEANFNIVNRWETGQRGFYWQDFLSLVEFKKLDLATALQEVTHFKFSEKPDSHELISKLTTATSSKQILKDSFSGQKINRLAAGKSKLLFSDFLWVIEALYGRAERFIYKFLAGFSTTEIDAFFGESNQKHSLVSDPFYALLRLSLSLEAYRELPEHSNEVLADFLRYTPTEIQEGIALLEEAGAITKKVTHYIANDAYLDSGGKGKEDSRRFVNHLRRQIVHATQDITVPTPGIKTAYIIYASNPDLEEKIFDVCRKFYIDIKKLVAAAPDKGHDRLQYMGVELFRMDPSAEEK